MKKVQVESFKVIGISVRTSNQNGQSAQDIGQLWNTFMSENIASKIPNKVDASIYAIYTNYEGDYMQPYDTILACKVGSITNVPEGMVAQEFAGGTYQQFISKGDLSHGVVYNTWKDIWRSELRRLYSADFEIYGEKAQHSESAEVDIFVAIED